MNVRGLLALCLLAAVLAAAAPAHAVDPVAWNTYQRLCTVGKERLKKSDYRGAQDAFEQALRYHDADADAYVGLGTAYAHQQDASSAERAFRNAVDRDPRQKLALVALGELAQKRDDLEAAAGYWERAIEIDPADEQLRYRLERIRREHSTEKDFNHATASHFSVKYEGRERHEAGRIVLRILEEAYGEVGRALSFYPDREIGVILYSGQQFRDVTEAPEWSGGVFDGKIRMPIGGIERETPELRRVLFHEYTHAAVRAIAPRVPTWLNEGLAQYFEGRAVDARQTEMLRQVQRAGKMPPLRSLEGSFMGLGGAQASYAYLISLSATRHLIDQYGMYRARQLLDELAGGADTGRAIDSALMLSYEEFERGWRRTFE